MNRPISVQFPLGHDPIDLCAREAFAKGVMMAGGLLLFRRKEMTKRLVKPRGSGRVAHVLANEPTINLRLIHTTMKTPSRKFLRRLASKVNVSQRGNESQFGNDT